MATAFPLTAAHPPATPTPLSPPDAFYFNPRKVSFLKIPTTPTILTNSTNHNFAIHSHFSDSDTTGGGGAGGGGDFIAGFLLGGAICGTLTYFFAPQIRRSLLNEDEYGFRKARRPIYYDDEGLEKTRQTLNAKLSQLNAAIDNVSSRLRGVNNMHSVPASSDPEVESTI